MIPVAQISSFEDKISSSYATIYDIDDLALTRHASVLDQEIDQGESYLPRCRAWREICESKLYSRLFSSNNQVFKNFKEYIESKHKTEAEVYSLVRIADFCDFLAKNNNEMPPTISFCYHFFLLRKRSGLKNKVQREELYRLKSRVWEYYLLWFGLCVENGGDADGKKVKNNAVSFRNFVQIFCDNEFQADMHDDFTPNDANDDEEGRDLDPLDVYESLQIIEIYAKLKSDMDLELQARCGQILDFIKNRISK